MLSYFSEFIYSTPARAWLDPDNGKTARRAGKTSQRVMQSFRTACEKYGNAGQLETLIKMPFSAVNEQRGLNVSGPDNSKDISPKVCWVWALLVCRRLKNGDICAVWLIQ